MKKNRVVLIAIVSILAVLLVCGCSEDLSAFNFVDETSSEALGYETVTEGDFTYNVYGEYAELVSYNGSKTAVTIPTSASGKPVTAIVAGAFESKNVNSVTIPTSVTEIGAYAFYNTKITTITIPETVNKLGYAAFCFKR